MSDIQDIYPYRVDLSNCENEPLELIQVVQPYSALLACRLSDFLIYHASENTASTIGIPVAQVLGRPLAHILGQDLISSLRLGLQHDSGVDIVNPMMADFTVGGEQISKYLVFHQTEEWLLVEIEPAALTYGTTAYQRQISQSIEHIQQFTDYPEMIKTVASEVRRLTGYDRVMIYQFDKDFNGEVIAESRDKSRDSYLGLRYPASDIPRQARDLYMKNKVRIIVDATEAGVRIKSTEEATTQPQLRIGLASCRGVSPIHLEYLENMGVQASFSLAITNEDRLWGLIACHHYAPHYQDYHIRNLLKFVSQIFSAHLSLHATHSYRNSTLLASMVRSQLFEQMSTEWNVLRGLSQGKYTLLNMINDCPGGAIYMDNELALVGATPNEAQVRALLQWLDEQVTENLYSTHELVKVYPPAADFMDTAAGVLAIPISAAVPHSYVLWFRPEQVQEVSWGGNPYKAMQSQSSENGSGRLSPRKSFVKWVELVQQQAKPWSSQDQEAALALRVHIKDVTIERFREMEKVNHQLKMAYQDMEGFSYTVSHDLRGPLRGIDGFAQILLEDYGEVLGDEGRRYVNTIIQGAKKMNDFIRDILTYSKIGHANLTYNDLHWGELAHEVWPIALAGEDRQRRISLHVQDDIPVTAADHILMQQVMSNLLTNAVKYTRRVSGEAKVEVGGQLGEDEQTVLLYVRDNGIGMDEKYAPKVFEMFNRLVLDEEYEGTGLGLTIVKRIVEQHHGSVSLESKVGAGTTFWITLPLRATNVAPNLA